MKLLVTTYLTDRSQIPSWLVQNNLKVICEVGVKEGVHLSHLLASNPTKAYAIDVWSADPEFTKTEINANQEYLENAYNNVLKLREKYPQLTVIRDKSVNASIEIPDGSLDFCYIDADHTYEGAKSDIEAYWPKVKPGGYLAGHDYVSRVMDSGAEYGVIQAVHEFLGSLDLHENLYTTSPRESSPSWFIRKPS